MRAHPLFSAIFLFSLLLNGQPAMAKSAQTTPASAIKLAVPDGLCALPDTAMGRRIFNNLGTVQRTAGNALLGVYLTCDDTDLILKGTVPVMSHYSLVATTLRQTGAISRQAVIEDVKRGMPAMNDQNVVNDLTAPANSLLKGSAIERLDMADDTPFRVVGEDENGLYVLNRAVRRMRDGSNQNVIGLFGITGLAGEPLFAYFYDTPPKPDSPSRLTKETIAYLAKLDTLNPERPASATPPHE